MSDRKRTRGRREPPLSGAAATRSGETAGRAGGGRARGKARAPARRRGGWLDRAVRGLLALTARWTWLIGSRLALGLALVLAGATAIFYAQLPPASALLDGRAQGSVTLLDRHGEVFAWRGQQYGGALRASEVSPHLVHAVIATEDRRFWSHWGIDPLGLARAMAANLRAGRLVQGGSTLTQQTAKNVFLTHERSVERKLKELPMALAMELKYSKEEILSIYLNRVYLGAGAYGFEAAAQRYFGTSARLASPAEAAMLAGLLKAPSRYAPTSNLADAQGRAGVIVGLMEDQGFLTAEQAERARAAPAGLSDAAEARAGGAFADWVMEAGPAWLTRETTEDVVIRTTFDPALQRAAEEALARIFAQNVREGSQAQAAIAVMDHDGAVRALVGGRDGAGAAGRFNRATQAKRQTGSAFKPIVYAAALEAGMRPNDVVVDEPLTIKDWSPRNYGGEYLGPVTLTEALARSVNTVAVRVARQAGLRRVRETAQALGVASALAPGPAVALGTSEATLLETTGVYAALASGGLRTEPYGILRVALRGEEDVPLMSHGGGGEGGRPRAISARAAGELGAMMQEVIRSGTGRRAALPDGRPAAGKTGTTQAARDAWFVGFTADYVAGVWMGYDDNTPLTGVTGGGLPAAIWRETMVAVHAGLPIRALDFPDARGEVGPMAGTGSGSSGGGGGGGVIDALVASVAELISGGDAASGQGPRPSAQPERIDR